MDQASASSLAGFQARDYSKYQPPRLARIRRKPVAPSHSDSTLTLRDEENDQITELRNPLARTSMVTLPDKTGTRPCTGSTMADEDSPRRLPDHMARRLTQRKGPGTQLWDDFREHWAMDMAWLGISAVCLIGEIP